jgi:hypothetical protein
MKNIAPWKIANAVKWDVQVVKALSLPSAEWIFKIDEMI